MNSLGSSFLLLSLLPMQAEPRTGTESKVDPTVTSKKGDQSPPHPGAGALRARSLGPALMSGRVVGFAVDPTDRSKYFAAVASGGVWKTVNAGTSWTPVFDNEGSYSIGCIVLDPKNPNTVWVGTGENNSQRSVGYGDGVYKSIDGGKTWRNVGLKASEHIGKIIIDPRDSDTVYVAAQGPLWGPGGDRGLYKTTDGGKTWIKILHISENTGVTSLVIDPTNPDVMIAAAYQRRRHVYTIINGGPESALYRTTDGGKTWTKIRSSLPTVDMGRIGLAQSPSDPATVYAIVEAADKQGGIFVTHDRGITWEKRNPFDQQAQYYSHIVVDPKSRDRIYVMNVFIQFSDDGGRTLRPIGERWKHVDSHEIWIDPKHPDYYLVGCDGGIYESHDRGAHWRHTANLPVTQFYDVTCEQTDTPFYKVYGGTQDNNTIGGPVRTLSNHGIANHDWHILLGGDGFQCRVDPKDPNIVYAEYQYGGLVRFDWRTGQRVPIQPQAAPGDSPLRWNWDSPLIISPHNSNRIYFAAQRLFMSNDRGDSWTPVSGDLTRQLDRNKLPVFGKIQRPEAVFKHGSTSIFGNITAVDESPKKEGLIYVGTDDGLIQVTEDGGKSWRKIDRFPGVPEMTYVARLVASQHQPATVYAVFENHKNSDFAPYVLRSTDAGRTWASITGDLPTRGSALSFAEDHVAAELLFVGTEFGLYFTVDGGKKWHRLANGLPTISVKDLCIQRKMNDLVIGTFGRGFYVIDDYSILRSLDAQTLAKPAAIFPVRDGFQYMPTSQFGGRGKASLGEAFYSAENPTYGVTIRYHLRDATPTRKQRRRDAERKGDAPYPTLEELRAETEEEESSVTAIITDPAGIPIRTLTGSAGKGLNRIQWDLREASTAAPRAGADDDSPFVPGGPPVIPGKYRVDLYRKAEGTLVPLNLSTEFQVRYVGPSPLKPEEFQALQEYRARYNELRRALSAVNGAMTEMGAQLEAARSAIDQSPKTDAGIRKAVRDLLARHRLMTRMLNGDSFLTSRNEAGAMSISERANIAADGVRQLTSLPTQTQRTQLAVASAQLGQVKAALKSMAENDVKNLQNAMDDLGLPWTTGRRPR